jgi:hypothetical protein
MANAVYPIALKKLMDGDIDLLVNTIKVMLIDTGTPGADYQATDDFMADIAEAGRIGASAALDGKSTTGGVFNANDATWAAVTGATCEAAIIYVDTADAATDILLVWMDTFDSGFPFTPNGGGFTLTWHVSGIFSI